MTVGEMISLLEGFDENLEIVPVHYSGEGSREELYEPEINDKGQVEI
jgi:hypothetical protein